MHSCIECHRVGGQICMDHCPTCDYFAGRQTWNCFYSKKAEGQESIEDFRRKIKELKKRIFAKSENPNP